MWSTSFAAPSNQAAKTFTNLKTSYDVALGKPNLLDCFDAAVALKSSGTVRLGPIRDPITISIKGTLRNRSWIPETDNNHMRYYQNRCILCSKAVF